MVSSQRKESIKISCGTPRVVPGELGYTVQHGLLQIAAEKATQNVRGVRKRTDQQIQKAFDAVVRKVLTSMYT